MNIENDTHFNLFIKSRNLTESSRKVYKWAINHYCDYLKLTPTEFIEEAENEEEERLRMKKRKIKIHLIDFLNFAEEMELSSTSRKHMQTLIRTFYREFEIELPHPVRIVDDEEELITADLMIQKEHIKKALNYANLKYKAIIKVIMSSGMGISEISELTYSNFLNSLDLPEKLYSDELREIIDQRNEIDKVPCWKIRRFKTKKPYFTFGSPESVYAILDYLEYLERKQRYHQPEDYLFCDPNMEQSAVGSMVQKFRIINDHCGFGFLGRQRFFKTHNLRKYFATHLYTSGVREKTIDWLLGHEIIVVNGRYIKSDIEAVKLEYLKGLDELSMENVEVKLIESKDLQKLREVSSQNVEIRSDMEGLHERLNFMQPIMEVLNDDPELMRQVLDQAKLKNKK